MSIGTIRDSVIDVIKSAQTGIIKTRYGNGVLGLVTGVGRMCVAGRSADVTT